MSQDLDLVIRIIIGTALGGVIGYERRLHGRPAGLRTHAIVALASSTFMVVSSHMVYYQHYQPSDFTAIDGTRIAASVVSGIGFLAGGTILRNGVTVQGLTTAAGLWLVAAIGLAAGSGMYIESVTATAVGVTALTILRRFEDKDDRPRRRLVLTLTDGALGSEALLAKLAALGLGPTLEAWTADRTGAIRQLTVGVRLSQDGGEAALVTALDAEPGITRVQLEPPA